MCWSKIKSVKLEMKFSFIEEVMIYKVEYQSVQLCKSYKFLLEKVVKNVKLFKVSSLKNNIIQNYVKMDMVKVKNQPSCQTLKQNRI